MKQVLKTQRQGMLTVLAYTFLNIVKFKAQINQIIDPLEIYRIINNPQCYSSYMTKYNNYNNYTAIKTSFIYFFVQIEKKIYFTFSFTFLLGFNYRLFKSKKIINIFRNYLIFDNIYIEFTYQILSLCSSHLDS